MAVRQATLDLCKADYDDGKPSCGKCGQRLAISANRKYLYSLNSAVGWVGMFAVAKRARSDRQYLPSIRSTIPHGSPHQLPPVGIPMA
jgi:hypothetical protein